MPGRDYDAITAARFAITIDGVQLGRFEMLFAATAPGVAPRALQPQELPLLGAGQLTPGEVTHWDHTYEIRTGKYRSRQTWAMITLKRGVASRAALERWQSRASGSLTLAALNPSGQPIARYRLEPAWPVKVTGPALHAKRGNDVAIETLEIAHAGMRLD
jgi:phage tail-like protein